MTVYVCHHARGDMVIHAVWVMRRVMDWNGKVMAEDRAALEPKEAVRLAEAIRHPSSLDYGSGFFQDLRTGENALHADLVPMESFFLYWSRERGPDATDSLWDTEWPDAWAEDIERAAKEVDG